MKIVMQNVTKNVTKNVTALIDALGDAGLLARTSPSLPETIDSLADDSRNVTSGGCFIAVRGVNFDGHNWLASAEAAGASMAIVEDESLTGLPSITVRDGRRAAAIVAAAYYGWPSRDLTVVGVTGTNGKTTTVDLLRVLLDDDDAHSASIGTLGVLIGKEGESLPGGAGLTTPGPVEMQRLLRRLADSGVSRVAMEVSSHALHQKRVDGIQYSAAVFTNLTRDHLDYHGDMSAYRSAKLRLLGLLSPGGIAVINSDDENWPRSATNSPTVTFGIENAADVSAREIVYSANGCKFLLVTPTGALHVALPLIGSFNVANAVAASATAFALGLPLQSIVDRLAKLEQVPGRLERICSAPVVLRDYAHTPDALERALLALRPFVNTAGRAGETARGTGRLIVLFGCGGDRDRGKRPEMGRIAESIADVVIVTSDNPRTEDPEAILDDIEAGMSKPHIRITDRRDAIAHTLSIARDADIVILAGKGHETYQIRGTTTYPFDERQIVQEIMNSEKKK